jgi:hypothetical protein
MELPKKLPGSEGGEDANCSPASCCCWRCCCSPCGSCAKDGGAAAAGTETPGTGCRSARNLLKACCEMKPALSRQKTWGNQLPCHLQQDKQTDSFNETTQQQMSDHIIIVLYMMEHNCK